MTTFILIMYFVKRNQLEMKTICFSVYRSVFYALFEWWVSYSMFNFHCYRIFVCVNMFRQIRVTQSLSARKEKKRWEKRRNTAEETEQISMMIWRMVSHILKTTSKQNVFIFPSAPFSILIFFSFCFHRIVNFFWIYSWDDKKSGFSLFFLLHHQPPATSTWAILFLMGIERHVYLVFLSVFRLLMRWITLLLFHRKTININMFGSFHNKFNLYLPFF